MNKSDKKNFGSAVRLPQTGDTIGVQRSAEGALHVHINDVDLGPAVYGIPEVWELNFSCTLYVASSQPSWLLHSEVMRSVGAFGRVELAEIFGSFKTAGVLADYRVISLLTIYGHIHLLDCASCIRWCLLCSISTVTPAALEPWAMERYRIRTFVTKNQRYAVM